MAVATFFDRRACMKWLGAAPLVAYIAAQGVAERALAAVTRKSKDNIYTRIGVKPLINARGDWTYLSGSLELPEVRRAKEQAALHYVEIVELQRAVGKRLAELSGAESGLITSGAAGAMAAATAACIAGSDPVKIWQLPDTTGLKNEVIMFGGRSAFDSAIRLAGGRLVVAHTPEQLAAGINDRTAMVYTMGGPEMIEKALAVTKKAKVPLLADQAGSIPPMENLKLFARMGCDLYTFSGGKGLCGPQCSGLLLGRKDLIDAALANSSPWEGAVCRPMKVGKEEIMGCLAAVEAWTKKDFKALEAEWNTRAKRVAKLVQTVPGVTTEVRGSSVTVLWDEKGMGFSLDDCDKELREGDPRIEVMRKNRPSTVPGVTDDAFPKSWDLADKGPDRLRVVCMPLQPGEDLIIGNRLREILGAAHARARVARAGRGGTGKAWSPA